MKINRIIPPIILLLVLVACMPQSKYKPAEIELPEDFRVAIQKRQKDSTEFVGDSMIYRIDSSMLAWNHYFKIEQMVELIEAGLQNSFDVREAYKKVEIYHLKFKQANMEFLPSISGNLGGVNYQYRSDNFYSNPSSNWYNANGKESSSTMYNYQSQNITGLNFSWEIDIWGKIRSQRAEDLYKYLATKEATNAIKTQLVADVSSGYINLLMLYAQLYVAEKNYDLSTRTLKMIELQYEAGNTTALAKQQTRAQMLMAKSYIPSLKQLIAQQENELQFLTGKLPSEIKVKINDFESLFSSIEKNYSVPLSIVSYRTDVKKAEYELWASNAAVGVAQTRQYPQLTIDLGLGVNSMLARNWFNIPGSLFGSIIGNFTQPIFNKKRFKTAFEQAKIEREIKEINLQKKVYGAIMEISNVLTKMNALDDQIEIHVEQVENSLLTINQANLLFTSGYATYLEVINAQRVALESELKLIKLKEERLQMKIKLYKALGGGW